MPDKNFLPEDLYETITKNTPIVCVDIIPIKKTEKWQAGMIRRATGSQAGKLTILGGRIYHSEKIDDAIRRHLKTDLSIDNFAHSSHCSEEKPFMVQQYFMKDQADINEYGFDPTKHALALTYLVEIDEQTIIPKNEASEFAWINDPITDANKTGFNQSIVINKVLKYLNQ